MSRSILCAMLLAILASAFVSVAQPDEGDSAAREKAFIEALQREDPASAARFIALRVQYPCATPERPPAATPRQDQNLRVRLDTFSYRVHFFDAVF